MHCSTECTESEAAWCWPLSTRPTYGRNGSCGHWLLSAYVDTVWSRSDLLTTSSVHIYIYTDYYYFGPSRDECLSVCVFVCMLVYQKSHVQTSENLTAHKPLLMATNAFRLTVSVACYFTALFISGFRWWCHVLHNGPYGEWLAGG